MRIRIGIGLASLVLSLAVLEVALRTIGYFVRRSRQELHGAQVEVGDGFERYGETEGRKTIITIGDSFTYGGGVSSHQTYPYQLYKLLQKHGDDHAVLNLGYCEDNTFGVTTRLTSALQSAKADGIHPEAVVVLVGSSDRFNRTGLVQDTSEFDLRILSMARAIRLALIQRDLAGAHLEEAVRGRQFNARSYPDQPSSDELEDTEPDDVALLEKIYQGLRQAALLQQSGEYDRAQPHLDGAIALWRENEMNMDAVTSQMLVARSDPNRAYMLSTVSELAEIYATLLQHDLAFERLLDVATNFPVFWSDHSEWEDLRYKYVQIMQLQSRIDPPEVLAALTRARSRFPELARLPAFQTHFKDVRNWDDVEREVAVSRKKYWDAIVATCAEHDVPLVVANYPTDYQSANRAVAEVSARYGLPLVDNHRIFSGLIAKDGRTAYLMDDDHCSPRGYRHLAKNVFDTLMQNGVISYRPPELQK